MKRFLVECTKFVKNLTRPLSIESICMFLCNAHSENQRQLPLTKCPRPKQVHPLSKVKWKELIKSVRGCNLRLRISQYEGILPLT